MKKRLDVLLTERGLAPSREKAKALIMSGIVYVNGLREDKPGMNFDTDSGIEVRGKSMEFVSRGGLKLKKGIGYFGIDVSGLVCLDIGASTGGFTDCMLQNGASKVYAIDVGYGQFDWRLRNDPRVVCFEKTNIRYVKPEDIGELCDFAAIDVSFISLTKVLVPVCDLLKEEAEICALIKPQFEAGRELVGKKGVVRDPAVHVSVIRQILEYAGSIGLFAEGLTYSPVKGPEGNIEYLVWLKKGCDPEYEGSFDIDVEYTVKESHELL